MTYTETKGDHSMTISAITLGPILAAYFTAAIIAAHTPHWAV